MNLFFCSSFLNVGALNSTSGHIDLTYIYWLSSIPPLQYGTASSPVNWTESRYFTVAARSGIALPESRSLAKRSSTTAVRTGEECIPSNQEKPPSALRQAIMASSNFSSVISLSDLTPRDSARRLTYNASVSESTSLPRGSIRDGTASRIISMMLISLQAAPTEVILTNAGRRELRRLSLSIPARRTAECTSLTVSTAGSTGMLTAIPSEYFPQSETNTAFRPIFPAFSGSSLKISLTEAPAGIVTFLPIISSFPSRFNVNVKVPSTGISRLDERATESPHSSPA